MCISFSSLLRSNNSFVGTFDHAQHTAVATMHVYERGLVAVNSDDGPNLTNLLGEAALANHAAVVVNMK
jgi:hypothetical protein